MFDIVHPSLCKDLIDQIIDFRWRTRRPVIDLHVIAILLAGTDGYLRIVSDGLPVGASDGKGMRVPSGSGVALESGGVIGSRVGKVLLCHVDPFSFQAFRTPEDRTASFRSKDAYKYYNASVPTTLIFVDPGIKFKHSCRGVNRPQVIPGLPLLCYVRQSTVV